MKAFKQHSDAPPSTAATPGFDTLVVGAARIGHGTFALSAAPAPAPPPVPVAPPVLPPQPPARPAPDNDSSAGEEDPGAALEELGPAGLTTPAGSSAAGSPARPDQDATADGADSPPAR